MRRNTKLLLIKLMHTLIWIVIALASAYCFYAVIIMKFDIFFFICLLLIIIEVVILASNKFVCPLNPIAARYTENRKPGFDIFLPVFIAKNNTVIFTVLYVAGILIFFINLCIRHF